MKRFLTLLLVVPCLGSCALENDYYSNDYRPHPPEARVERPYSTHYHRDRGASHATRNEPNTHQHNDRNNSRSHEHDENNEAHQYHPE